MYEQLICNNITLKISIWNVYTIFEKYFFLFVNKIIFFNLINLWIEPIVFFGESYNKQNLINPKWELHSFVTKCRDIEFLNSSVFGCDPRRGDRWFIIYKIRESWKAAIFKISILEPFQYNFENASQF